MTEIDIGKVQAELLAAEIARRDALETVAKLEGQLNEDKHTDLAALRLELARAKAEMETASAERERIAKELAHATRRANEEEARADAVAFEAGAAHRLNADLSGAVQALNNKTRAAPAAPRVPTPPPARPWYGGKVFALVCGAALVLAIAAIVMMAVYNIRDSEVNVVSGQAPALAEVSESRPEIKPAAPPVQSIQPTTPARSGSCPYASLTACVNDMAARIGVAPSDASIRKYGPYSCRRIGCY